MSTEKVALQMGASAQIAEAIEDACIEFGIDSTLEKAHFLGQMHVESAGFKVFRESLNYSVEGLLSTFERHRVTDEQAHQFGRKAGQAARQEALANILYGGEWGAKNLGNTQPGDGWAFIGRGLKQLTGRDNYTRCSRGLHGDDRLLDNPRLLEQLPDMARSAGWFWTSRPIKSMAARDDILGVTRAVNGGTNGLDARISQTRRAQRLFQEMTR